MRMHRVLLGTLCLVLAVLTLTSCNTGKGVVDPATQFAALRVVNLIPDATGPLNVTIDTKPLASGLNFEALTPYQQIDAGTRIIEVSIAGGSSTILSKSLSFVGTTNYTLVISGTAAEPSSLLINDATVDPGSGNFSFRALNVATGVPLVDVYVTPPGADLNLAAPAGAGIALAAASAFVNVPVGNYQIRVTSSGTKDVIYDSTPQAFGERAHVEAVVYTRTSNKLVGVTVLNLDGSGSSTTTPNLLAQFKVINGSSVASPLNVFINQNLLLSNIPFGGASSYQKTASGAPTISIQATATPGASLLTLTPTLGPGTDSSILITGSAGALKALVLGDNNLPPVPNRARVRFVNASDDIPLVDVFVNFSKLISSLAMSSASTGVEFSADPVAGTTYEFDFNVAGTAQPSLKLPSITLFGGRTYTIYIVGPQSALSGIFTGDN